MSELDTYDWIREIETKHRKVLAGVRVEIQADLSNPAYMRIILSACGKRGREYVSVLLLRSKRERLADSKEDMVERLVEKCKTRKRR